MLNKKLRLLQDNSADLTEGELDLQVEQTYSEEPNDEDEGSLWED